MPRLPGFAAILSPGAAPPLTAGSIWPVPVVVFSALLIAWAAEVAEFFVSQGLALAVLAFLQVLPEFAVEAAIAHNAAQNPSLIGLVTANFTGSNRLLVGVGLPLVFFLAAFAARRRRERFRAIELRPGHSVEVLFLLIPTAYMAVPYLRGALGLVDSAVLASIFGLYLWILGRLPPEPRGAAEVVPGVAGFVLTKSARVQKSFVLGGFLGGGLLLFLAAEPFLGAMMGVAAALGISTFFFVQWIAPALSEFPEFIAASRWAVQVRAATPALVNILSAKVNQWTLLVAMIPMVFSISLGRNADVPLGDIHGVQRVELLLTAAQSVAAVAIFLKMRMTALDAGLLFGLWFFQFVEPGLREEMIPVYLAFAVFEVVRHRKELRLLRDFREVLRSHAVRRPA
ncbi:MAG: sodium:calcium antiporter [Halobacteria archaeon]